VNERGIHFVIYIPLEYLLLLEGTTRLGAWNDQGFRLL